MSQGDDVCRTNCIVTSGERSRTAIARNIDWLAIPPLVGLIAPAFVTLQIILNQYLRFVCIVAFAPPCQAK